MANLTQNNAARMPNKGETAKINDETVIGHIKLLTIGIDVSTKTITNYQFSVRLRVFLFVLSVLKILTHEYLDDKNNKYTKAQMLLYWLTEYLNKR